MRSSYAVMEQKFKTSDGIDLRALHELCEREGEEVAYRKGDQMEREGDPARWFGFVTKGCFKYINHGISDGKAHTTWFSFEGEFVGDYPAFLYGQSAQTTIEAMMPSRVLRLNSERLNQFFCQSMEAMKLRAVIGEHILSQYKGRYHDLHCTTPRERYDLLMRRCPGIVDLLDLQDIASFLNVTPKTISMIRRDITFGQ